MSITEKKMSRVTYSASVNGRFCEMAAVNPQTWQCKSGNLYHAAISVKADTSQSRWTLAASGGQRSVENELSRQECKI
jgi:hypothetical protein